MTRVVILEAPTLGDLQTKINETLAALESTGSVRVRHIDLLEWMLPGMQMEAVALVVMDRYDDVGSVLGGGQP